ncbi:MAG: DUF4157 domain-containing protein [Chloroflexi bacterium]|nr:DUF4157 domain-containing protein [Chloroflexota bacterium]MCI0575343.1 DUF4157 domain-containing protein [Chloroflexota bacterium]MCI0645817.1 DUF4157 domain-containing protein [Chloroflexota bacterium]MCI0730971.1 DUF4157 domain-containing protein [Chloroflexota bacterium]
MSEQAAAPTQKANTRIAPPESRALERQCACGQHTVAGGECEQCRKKRLKLQRWSKDRAEPAAFSGMDYYRSELASTGAMASRFGHDFSQVRSSARELMVQRLAEREDVATTQSVEPVPVTEPAGPATETSPSNEPAIPAPAEPATEPTVSGATAVPGLLVEDEATDLGEGKMRKNEFLAELRPAVCAAADAELAAAGRNTEGCPYLDYWFDYYSQRDAGHIEQALRRYASEAASATSARDYIPIVAERVRQGVERWARTGEITGVPEGLSIGLPGAGLIGSLVSGIGHVFFKARAGGARADADPQVIREKLGNGRPLDSGVRSRMESAFGASFSYVRTHADSNAAGLSSNLNAHAFTVGEHVAFGAGEYRPGTLLGDALIAHELAHVVQQGGTTASIAPMEMGDASYETLEVDADRSAVTVMASLWGRTTRTFTTAAQNAVPRLRSGLRLQRCATGSQQAQPGTARATSPSACLPTLENPRWSVAPRPILRPRDGCSLQLAQDVVRPGMKFDGFINVAAGCEGRIYFVQYASPNRVLVSCPGNTPEGLCVRQAWGIDTGWPYGAGSNYRVSGNEGRAIQTEDSPGQRNISNPETRRVRICMNEEFVTYIVFERPNNNVTPLGWMHWQYNAQGWRDNGNCPPTSTAADCTGWQVTGAGQKVGDSFVPGSMHATVPLNRSAPVVDPMSLLANARDCSATECQLPPTGSSPPPQ